MGASCAVRVALLRCGPGHVAGGPYELCLMVTATGAAPDLAVLEGAVGTEPRRYAREIAAHLAALGFARVMWERHDAHGRVRRVVGPIPLQRFLKG